MAAEQEPKMVEVLVTRVFRGLHFALLRGMEEISISGMDLTPRKMYLLDEKDFEIDNQKGSWVYKSKDNENQASRNIDKPVTIKSFFCTINPRTYKPRILPKPEHELEDAQRDQMITEWYQDAVDNDGSLMPVGDFLLPSFPEDDAPLAVNITSIVEQAALAQQSKSTFSYFIGNCKLVKAGLTKEKDKYYFRFCCWNNVIVQDMFFYCSTAIGDAASIFTPFVTISAAAAGSDPQFTFAVDEKGRPVNRSCIIYFKATKSSNGSVSVTIVDMISGGIPNPTLVDLPFDELSDNILGLDTNTLVSARKDASKTGTSWQTRYFIFPLGVQAEDPLTSIEIEVGPKLGKDKKPTGALQSIVTISKGEGEQIKITNGPPDSNLPVTVKLWRGFFFFSDHWSNTFEDHVSSEPQQQ